MFKLAAAICNHFVVVPYIEAKGSVPTLEAEANETFRPGRTFAWPSSRCSDDIPAWREGGRTMFKLAAAIRNHFFFIQYLEAKAPSSRRPRQVLAPTTQTAGVAWRSPNVVVPTPSMASHSGLHPSEIQAMNASMDEGDAPVSTPPLLPDSSLVALASKAPALCSQLRRKSR
jgi:hypothetical protein